MKTYLKLFTIPVHESISYISGDRNSEIDLVLTLCNNGGGILIRKEFDFEHGFIILEWVDLEKPVPDVKPEEQE